MRWTQRDWSDRLARGLWADDAAAARLHALLAGHTVILASASPRRRAILRQCRVRFRVWNHTLDEPPPRGPDWRGWVRRWAWRKAADAAAHQRRGLVIAADTIVVQGPCGLGKPRTHAQARAMLRSLSGRTHQVYTGVAVINVTAARHAAGSAVSHVHFRRLSDREIAGYIRSGEPADKAGAYAIQGGGGQFVDRIAGPLDNIIGLPVGCLNAVLARVLR
ncbi:MAG TPA: Maf family protein [bacterium]|nr:Maf family protein [bacterium]